MSRGEAPGLYSFHYPSLYSAGSDGKMIKAEVTPRARRLLDIRKQSRGRCKQKIGLCAVDKPYVLLRRSGFRDFGGTLVKTRHEASLAPDTNPLSD